MEIRWIGIKDCPNCGENDWYEFERSHGVPYYRCRNCGKVYPTVELDICMWR